MVASRETMKTMMLRARKDMWKERGFLVGGKLQVVWSGVAVPSRSRVLPSEDGGGSAACMVRI